MLIRASVVAFAFMTVHAVPVAAQQRDTTAQRADTTRPAVPLPEVVVTGTKLPVAADRLGFALSVVDQRQLEVEPSFYAIDALRELPGAYIDEAAGPGGPAIIRLRGGEEVFTQILMDGVQINQNGGFFDFQGFTLTNIERIEVARGPQSAVYGSSAVSGVVHFITPRGRPGPARLGVSSEGGGAIENGGTFRTSATASGGTQTMQYSLGGGLSYSRGIYNLPDDTWTRDISARLDASPSDRWDLTGTFRFASIDANRPVRDPGARRVPLDPNARNERDRGIASVEAVFRPARRWTNRLRVSAYHEDFVFEDQRDDVALVEDFGFFIFDADFRLDSRLWRTTVEYVGSNTLGRLGGGGVTLSYGGQWEREDLEDRTSGEFGDGTVQFDRNSVAGFAELSTDLGSRASLLLGTRLEKFAGFVAQFTPRATAVVHVVPGVLSLRGAAGRAYKAPNLQEQFSDNPFIEANPDLEPETSTSWEVGTDVELIDGRAEVAITYFRQNFKNLIRFVAQENSTRQIARNLGESRTEGLEWSIRVRPGPRWRVGVDGSWILTEILDNTGLSDLEFPVGASLPFRPTVVTSAFLEVKPVERLTIVARGTAVGRQTVLTERFSGLRTDLKPYFLPGLTATARVAPGVSVYTRVDNVFDGYYKTAFDRPGIPLTAAAGVRLVR